MHIQNADHETEKLSLPIEIHKVPPLIEKIRFSDYAINIFKTLPTKSGVKKALKKNEIYIDDKIASSGDWLTGGEELRLKQEIKFNLYKLDYDVVYEDDYLAIIHKPAGVPVHSHAHRNIQNSLPHNLKPSSIPSAMQLPRPVHRLDHETSGLLIVAKTYEAMTSLGQDLAEGKVKKIYTTVAIGNIVQVSPITATIDDKVSTTNFKIIETISSEKYEKLNLLEIDLKTGRKNQIRRHFLGIENPILGDKKYFLENKLSYGNGLYLIANALSFVHPIKKDLLSVNIPLPQKFKRLFPNQFS